jgi:hypothetical protein
MAFQNLAALPLIIKIPFVCRLCLFCNGLPSLSFGLRIFLSCLFDFGPDALHGIPLALMILHICPSQLLVLFPLSSTYNLVTLNFNFYHDFPLS